MLVILKPAVHHLPRALARDRLVLRLSPLVIKSRVDRRVEVASEALAEALKFCTWSVNTDSEPDPSDYLHVPVPRHL